MTRIIRFSQKSGQLFEAQQYVLSDKPQTRRGGRFSLAACSFVLKLALREHTRMRQTKTLVQTEQNIHVLDSLTRSPFDQVINNR